MGNKPHHKKHGGNKSRKPGFSNVEPSEDFQEFDFEDEDESTENLDDQETIVLPPIDADYSQGKIVASLSETATQYFERHYYGTKEDETLEYNFFECLILLERNRIIISNPEKTSTYGFKEILGLASKDEPKFWIKYLVYRDLRYRGYVVRSGIGNSIDFRIYPRGTQHNTDTAKFLIFILPEGHPVKLNILDTLSRQSLSNRKDLLLAIVDQLGDISYYQLTSYNLQHNAKKKPFFEGIELKK